MMKIILAILGMAILWGCSSPEVGQGEIDKAYPQVSQTQLEADLAKAGKLEEYKEAKARDAAVEAQQGGGQ